MLLPTPVANDDNKTPEAHLANKQRWSYDGANRTQITSLSVLARAGFRQIAESLSTGATTDPPSNGGSASTGLRLSPWFVEWMIGAPQGWSDPDCPLSATEFKCSSEGSSGT